MDLAIPWRFTAQSNAESPPPTMSTRLRVNSFGFSTRSYSPLPNHWSASFKGSLRGVKAPIPPAMRTVRPGY